ncbi:MAG: hypothetical protein HYZ93_05530, partial [Candidatus Omnitrophica bacterium]|nr:hypothetical protein [Candidatus Omnitrophota bacterium]
MSEVGGASAPGMSLREMERLLKIRFADRVYQRYPGDRYEATLEASLGAINSPRALGILTILSKEDGSQKSFIMKRPNSVTEPAAAQYASDEHLGPLVLYASNALLIEEILPAGFELASRGLLLSPEEAALFGRRLADGFHKMCHQGKFLYSSNAPQTHLFLLGLGPGDVAVRFVDWSDALTAHRLGSAFTQLRALEELAFAVKTYLRKPRENVIAWKNFSVRLGEMEGEDRVYTDPDRGLLFRLRRGLMVENPDPDERDSWEGFYKAVDEQHVLGDSRIIVKGKALRKRMSPSRPSDISEESAQIMIQGRRSMRLRILHEESSLIDSKIAQAITMDLFERGYVGEAIHSSWGRVVGLLGIYLRSHNVGSETADRVQEELRAMRPPHEIVSSPSEVQGLLQRVLSRHQVEGARRFSEASVQLVVSHQMQSISIRNAILPGMRNRDLGETLEIYLEGKPEIKIKEYVLKSPHRPEEPSRSMLASRLNLGPHVVFARSGNDRPAVIVEDLLPPERNISRVDPAEFIANQQAGKLLAENLAVKFYTMMDPKRQTVMHAFDNRTQHIFVLGEEDGFDFLMIDWAFSNALGESRYHSGPNRVVEQIAGMLDGLYEDFEKFGPLFWREFKLDMI